MNVVVLRASLVAAFCAIGANAQSFEVASVKAIDPSTPSREPQIDSQRFILSGTLYDFITDAYSLRPCARKGSIGSSCALISGAPAWATKDRFEIQAALPANPLAVARNQFSDGEAPQLDNMLRSLLEDRFALKVHREPRELPVYLLTAKNGSKLKPSDGPILKQDAGGSTYKIQGLYQADSRNKGTVWSMGFKNISARGIADFLTTVTDRPVLDRSGIQGRFDFNLQFDTDPPPENSGLWMHMMANASAIRAALEEQLGLKLDSAKAPVNVLVIDHVEQPSAN